MHLWSISKRGIVYYHKGTNFGVHETTDKVDLGGGWRQISTNTFGKVYALTQAGDVWQRIGITEANPIGTDWDQIVGTVESIQAGKDDMLFGINKKGKIVYANLKSATPECSSD